MYLNLWRCSGNRSILDVLELELSGVVRCLLRLKSGLPTGLAWASDLWYCWGEWEIRFPPESIGLCLSGEGVGGGGIVGMSRKCSLRETVQPVGVGINMICKVSLALFGGIAVLPEGRGCSASGSKWKFRKSAVIGFILLNGISTPGFWSLLFISLAHRVVFKVFEICVFSMRCGNN